MQDVITSALVVVVLHSVEIFFAGTRVASKFQCDHLQATPLGNLVSDEISLSCRYLSCRYSVFCRAPLGRNVTVFNPKFRDRLPGKSYVPVNEVTIAEYRLVTSIK